MTFSFKINSHEVREYIKEDGITISNEERVVKEIITLDGSLYRKSISKINISISLLDNLISSNYTTFMSYITNNDSISIEFSNYKTGASYSGNFVLTNLSNSVKKGYGNDALLSGINMDFKEK